MIVVCPACRRQYRLDDRRFHAGAKMRCTRCRHMFEAGAAGAQAARPGAPPAPPAGDRAATAPPPLALVADAGRPFGRVVTPILESLGCSVRTVSEGTAAFRMAVADRPSLMVVSVHLAGLSGIAICEGVKNSPHLKAIRVALVGSDLSADLFGRSTALAYGADLFLEEGMAEPEIRHALAQVLRPSAGPDAGDEITDALAGLTGTVAGPPGVGEDIRRLARIMLADLRLYNPDRFRDALAADRLLEVFKDELARGRALVDQRFPELAARQDLLAAALRDGIERERAARPG